MQATSSSGSGLWRTAISLIVSAALIVVVAWGALGLISGTLLPGSVEREPTDAPYADYGERLAEAQAPGSVSFPDYGERLAEAQAPGSVSFPDYGERLAGER